MLASLKEVIEEGKKRKIAVGAFNTPNLECLLAVLGAAEKLDVPVIVSHAQLHESVAPIEKIGPVMVELAKRSKVKVCVHLDHGEDFEYCKKAIALGFTSVMIDCSALPYEENVAHTAEVVKYAHAHGVDVEAELGRLPNREGGAGGGVRLTAGEVRYLQAIMRRGLETLSEAGECSDVLFGALRQMAQERLGVQIRSEKLL